MILMAILSSLAAFVIIFLFVEIFRCKHQWEFVDKTEFPPPIEMAAKVGIKEMWISDIAALCKKTVVIVIRCPKCGTPKVLREKH